MVAQDSSLPLSQGHSGGAWAGRYTEEDHRIKFIITYSQYMIKVQKFVILDHMLKSLVLFWGPRK